MDEETKAPVQYILVRKDLPVEVQMVNVGHAAGESIRTAPIDKRTKIRLLHVADETELIVYANKLADKKFEFDIVNEPDEPYNNTAMALATPPMTERVSSISKVLYHLTPVRFGQ